MKTKLYIFDEVNVAFEGLQEKHIDEIIKRTKLPVKGAHMTAAYKLKLTDGKESNFFNNGSTFFFMLDKVLPIVCDDFGYDVEIEDCRKSLKHIYDHIDENFVTIDGNSLYDFQVNAVNEVIDNEKGVIEVSTSGGKAQCLYSKVLTPDGWSTIGNISVGDYVINEMGDPVKVIGKFPQGMKDCYEVTTTYGGKVRCCDEHLWNVRTKGDKSRGRGFKTLTLKEIMKYENNYWQLPLMEPAKFNKRDLKIHPYVMGAFIGDGSLKNNNISFHTPEEDIVEKIRKYLPEEDTLRLRKGTSKDICKTYGLVNENEHILSPTTLKYFQQYGLTGCIHNKKFIPDDYIYSSYDDRLELLMGLIDTDGYIDKTKGTSEFSTTSEKLAKQVKELVLGLGGYSRISSRMGKYKKNEKYHETQVNYRVYITFPKDFIFFSSKKHKSRYKSRSVTKANCISNIEYIGKEEMMCIAVESDTHLYITDDYTVTHNTVIGASIIKVFEKELDFITIVPSETLVKQMYETYSHIGLDVGHITKTMSKKKRDEEWSKKHVICTWQLLKNNKSKLKRFGGFIYDEAHVMGDVMFKILADELSHALVRIGMTATLPKKDKYKTEKILCRIGNGALIMVKPKELQDKKIISTCDIEMYPIKHYMDDIEEWDWDLEEQYLLNNKDRLKVIADFIKNLDDNKTLILCFKQSVQALSKLTGLDYIHGDVKESIRQEYYTNFKTIDGYKLLATYDTVGTGLSINEIERLLLIDAGKNDIRIVQGIGRGLRKDGKRNHLKVMDLYSKIPVYNRQTGKYREISYSGSTHVRERKKFYTDLHYPFEEMATITIKNIK